MAPSRLAVGLLALVALLSCYPFVAPGHPTSVDIWAHLARQSIVYHAFKEGFAPFYTFMFYCGVPVLRFYSPLFYLLSGPLTLLTRGDLLLALRIVLVVLHLLSAIAMYLCLLKRETGEERKKENAGLGPALGAVVYLVIPWRGLYLSRIANYPQALVYVLLPLVFLALENVLRGGDGKRDVGGQLQQALLLGLWVGLLVLSHVVYAVFALALLALCCLAKSPRRLVSSWRALSMAALAAISVSAFFLIPFVVEQNSHRFPITHLNLGIPDLMVLLGLRPRLGAYSGWYLGLSVVILLLAAIGAVLLRRRYRSQVPALIGLTISLVLTFGPALLREKQYLVTAGLPTERFLLFVIFFIALLVPGTYELLRGVPALRRVRPELVLAIVVGVVAVDCLPRLSGRYPDRHEILAVREEIYPIVGREPHARLIDLDLPIPRIDDVRRTGRLPAVGVVYGGLATPLGLYHQYAPRSMLYVYPWVNYIAGDLGDTTRRLISDNTRKALALMGASHFITLPTLVSASGTDAGPFSAVLKDEMDWDKRFFSAWRDPPLAIGRTHQGLVLAGNRIAPAPPETLVPDRSLIVAGNWRRLLDTLALDEVDHRLSFIPTPAGTRPESLPGLPRLLIDSTMIRHQDVVTGFQVSSDCFLRVAVSYYSELDVRLDGRPVRFFETADHFTCIRCPAGSHVVSVKARLGWLRTTTLLLSLVSLPLIVILTLRRKSRRPSSGVGT